MADASGSLDWLADAGLEPQVYEHLTVFEEQLWADAIEAPLLELIRLRIAQILDAPVELERRSPAAVAAGLDETMVDDLSNWPTSPKFDERQRAVLSWSEQWVIDPEQITDEDADATAGVAQRQGVRGPVDRARRVRIPDPHARRARPRVVAEHLTPIPPIRNGGARMSTARITPPEGGLSVFDHDPELWGTFNRFYGYLWTYGALDQPTKEAGAPAQRARHGMPDLPQPPVRRRPRAGTHRGLRRADRRRLREVRPARPVEDRSALDRRGHRLPRIGHQRGARRDRHRLHARGVRRAHAHRGDRAGLLEVGRRVGRRERHAYHHRAHADTRQRGDRRLLIQDDLSYHPPTHVRPVRIAGQPPENWSESTRAEFAGVDEAARHRLHLPTVIANHPTFLPPYMTWAKAVALSGVLDRRDNALLALRTGFRCDSEFEWGVHAETAVATGRPRRR